MFGQLNHQGVLNFDHSQSENGYTRVGCDLRVQVATWNLQLQCFAGLTSPQELPTTCNSPHELELWCLLKPLVKNIGVSQSGNELKFRKEWHPFLVNISGGCNLDLGVWISGLPTSPQNCQSTKLRSDNYDFMTPSLKIQRCQHVSKWRGLFSNGLHHRIHVWYIHLDLSFNTEINQKRYLNITSPINPMGTLIFSKEMFPRVLFFHPKHTENKLRLFAGWLDGTALRCFGGGRWLIPVFGDPWAWKNNSRPFVGLVALEGGWAPLQNSHAITCFMAHFHTFSRCENGCGKKQVDKNACNVCLDVFQRFPEGNLEPHTGRTIKLTDKMTKQNTYYPSIQYQYHSFISYNFNFLVFQMRFSFEWQSQAATEMQLKKIYWNKYDSKIPKLI